MNCKLKLCRWSVKLNLKEQKVKSTGFLPCVIIQVIPDSLKNCTHVQSGIKQYNIPEDLNANNCVTTSNLA